MEQALDIDLIHCEPEYEYVFLDMIGSSYDVEKKKEEKNLLIFPLATNVSRESLGNRSGKFSSPTKQNQVKPLEEKFTALDWGLKNRTLSLSQ